jgi:general secretion pathway protein I
MAMWNHKRVESGIRHGTTSSGHTASTGFTLLEVVVALAIVALLLVPLMRLHLLSLDATIQAQDLTTAVLLAQGQLTMLGAFPEPGEDNGTFEDPELAKYSWQTAVTEHTFDAEAGEKSVEVRRIEVTVRWTDGQSDRHYTLESYASR